MSISTKAKSAATSISNTFMNVAQSPRTCRALSLTSGAAACAAVGVLATGIATKQDPNALLQGATATIHLAGLAVAGELLRRNQTELNQIQERRKTNQTTLNDLRNEI